MIELRKLKHKLSNFKNNNFKLPQDIKYTQKSAFNMKIDDLSNIEYNENNKLEEYIYKKNKKQFSQIKNTIDNDIIYKNGDIIPISDDLKVIFDTNFDKYYIYGIQNTESFFTSLFFLTNHNFIVKSNNEKKASIISFKRDIGLKLDNIYKENKYSKLKFIKSEMNNDIFNSNNVNYPLLLLCCDYLKKNFCIIDKNKKSYLFLKSFHSENNSFLLIVKFNNIYMPILNIDNHNELDLDLFEKNIKHNFVKENIDNFTERLQESKENVIELKALSSYKLKELQDLAKDNNIEIKKEKDGKEKNKTKQELYNEILNI